MAVAWARGWIGKPYLDGEVPVMEVIARADDGGRAVMEAWLDLPRHPSVLEPIRIVDDGMCVAYADVSPAVPRGDRELERWLLELDEVFEVIAGRHELRSPALMCDAGGNLRVAFLPGDDVDVELAFKRVVREHWRPSKRFPMARRIDELRKLPREPRPDHHDAWRAYDRGHGFEQLKMWDSALAMYEQALVLDAAYIGRERALQATGARGTPLPETLTPLHRARRMLKLGFYADAIELGRQLRDVEPIEGRWVEASALMKLARPAEAIAPFAAIAALLPYDVDAHYQRGKALFAVKRYPEAIEAFERVTALRPSRVEAMLLRREADRAMRAVRAEVGEPTPTPSSPPSDGDTLAIYDAMLAVLPTDLDALEGRAAALKALGRTDEAAAAEELALTIALTRR